MIPAPVSWFAMGAVFGSVLCGWPWHPRFSRYSRSSRYRADEDSNGNCVPMPPAPPPPPGWVRTPYGYWPPDHPSLPMLTKPQPNGGRMVGPLLPVLPAPPRPRPRRRQTWR